MHKLRRLMNEVTETAGSGGGAVTPTEPVQAPAQAPANSGHNTNVTALIADAKENPATRNALFAEMRKQGLIGEKPKTAPTTQAPAQAANPTAPTAPVEPDLRKFDRAVNKASVALSDEQYDRMEKLFKIEAPSDVAGWVNDFIDTWGLRKPQAPSAPVATPQTPQPAAPPAPATAVPVTNTGNPPPPKAPPEYKPITSWNRDEINKYIADHGGGQKGLQAWNQFQMAELQKIRLPLK
jgi:hypothetical protein